MGVKIGGLSVWVVLWVILKTLKITLTDCFLTILIQKKTTPIKWLLSLKGNDLKNVFFGSVFIKLGIIKTFLKSYPLIKIKLLCYLIFKNALEYFLDYPIMSLCKVAKMLKA
ncbi:hypothetical protein HPCPY1662_0625 [Helicobacter pylori CPY1662]|nr:hypothetical protein HPCPY1662_0625 [Helicobacter pylori CPY1662]